MRPQAPGFRQLFLIGLCTAFAGIAQAQQIAQPTVIPTGNWPVAIYSADLNEDGKPDLIYIDAGATPYASTTHILLNNGNGTFRPGVTLATAGTALAIGHFDSVSTDFDPSATRDAHVDIGWVVVSGNNSTSLTAAFAYGKGDGTFLGPFGGHITLGEPNIPQVVSVIAAPVRSGGADLLFAIDAANPLGIDAFYYNSFYQTLPGPNGGGTLQVADLNNDGVSDLIVTPYGTAIDIFSSSPGNRARYSSSASPGPFYSSLLADIDGDGIPDLVVEGTNGALSYFPGTPTGFATTAIPIGNAQDGTTGNGGHLVAIADLNGDHIPDIITSTPAGISVLLGQPPLTSHIPYTPTYTLLGIYNAGPGRSSYALADFNSDGHLDLAVDSPEGIAILYGNPDGSFQTSRSYAAGLPAYSLAFGQFSGTGNTDVVVATGVPEVQVLSGDNKGAFAVTSPAFLPNPFTTNSARTIWSSVVAGNFDADGKTDVAVTLTSANPANFSLALTLDFGDSAGSFLTYDIQTDNLFTRYFSSAVGDFNGDGISDLAIFQQGGCITAMGTAVFHGPMSVSLVDFDPSPTAYNTGATGFLKSGRVDKQDVVCQSSTGLKVYRNNGDGTFTAAATLANPSGYAPADVGGVFPKTGLFPSTVLLTDLDGDGFGDIIAVYHNLASDPAHPTAATPNQINVYFGDGSGSFTTPPVSLLEPRNYYQAALADIYGTGKPQLILSDGYLLAVRPWDPVTRQFGAEQRYLAGMGINGIASFPINGHNVLVTANGGAIFTNPAINRGTLASNAEVNTGGITVLLPAANPLNTTLTGTLTAAPASPGYGRTFTLTAALTPPPGGTIPTGTVTFSVDGVVISTGIPVDATGTATYAVNSPTYTVGTHTLTAVYSGDATYSTLTLTGSVTVTLLPSQTYINNIVSPILYGDIIGNIAQGFASPLNPSDTAPLDGGNLVFSINGQTVCTLPFITGITQSCPPTTGAGYPVGTYTLSSTYTGNQFYTASTSPDYTVVVVPADTQASLASSLNPATAGQAVTFIATFSSQFATPTGQVTFFDGAVPIGSATVTAAGIATLTTSTLAVGTHPITATLAASQNFNASTTAVLQQVITPQGIPPVVSTTVLTSSINPSNVGQAVTFTALVTSGAVVSQAIPTGSITFTIDGVFVGTVTLNAQGAASITSSTLTAGGHIIAASYSGSPTGSTPAYLSSAGTLVQQVNVIAAGSFTLTVTPTTLSVPIGNSAIALATITALNGFSHPVTLSCTNLPRGVTCAFTSTTIPPGGGSTQLAVSATAPHDCSNNTPYFISSGSTSWVGLLASSGLILLLRRRRKLITAITLTLALCILPTTIGCGNCTDLGVYPGTYSFTVTATSTTPTAITATQTIQIKAHL